MFKFFREKKIVFDDNALIVLEINQDNYEVMAVNKSSIKNEVELSKFKLAAKNVINEIGIDFNFDVETITGKSTLLLAMYERSEKSSSFIGGLFKSSDILPEYIAEGKLKVTEFVRQLMVFMEGGNQINSPFKPEETNA